VVNLPLAPEIRSLINVSKKDFKLDAPPNPVSVQLGMMFPPLLRSYLKVDPITD